MDREDLNETLLIAKSQVFTLAIEFMIYPTINTHVHPADGESESSDVSTLAVCGACLHVVKSTVKSTV